MQRLGQHFLKNSSAIKKIVAALNLRDGDTIVEIGAGHGELTEEILRQATPSRFATGQASDKRQEIKIIAIEKDSALVVKLKEKFQDPNSKFQIQVLGGDALKILPKLLSDLKIPTRPAGGENFKLKILGNVPYYITGHLLRILSEAKNKPAVSVFTIQKEVAERICAQPPRMNRLAAITQFWAETKILFNLSPGDFSPPPEVDSAVIKLEERRENIEGNGISADKYYTTVRALFAQPRKTVLNNLQFSIFNFQKHGKQEGRAISKSSITEKLSAIGIKPADRPQNLSVEDIKKIAGLISNFQ